MVLRWRRAAATIALAIASLGASGCGGAAPPAAGAQATGTAPAASIVRYLAGGDSRDDASHVLPWAFAEARARGASGFFFLGDMEITPEVDRSFRRELGLLDPVPFFPALGNHEIQQFGFLPIGVVGAEKAFQEHFLGTPRTPVKSVMPGRVVYSTDLPGGVHFIALDNVTRPGFGEEQLAWLAADLARASADPATLHIIVGMHKPMAHNGVSPHGMGHDGAQATADSDAALALFQKHHVALILQSHVHQFARSDLGGIPAYVSGGLGAPLDRVGPDRAFHHFLQIDVDPGHLSVTVVKFPGAQSVASEGEPEDD